MNQLLLRERGPEDSVSFAWRYSSTVASYSQLPTQHVKTLAIQLLVKHHYGTGHKSEVLQVQLAFFVSPQTCVVMGIKGGSYSNHGGAVRLTCTHLNTIPQRITAKPLTGTSRASYVNTPKCKIPKCECDDFMCVTLTPSRQKICGLGELGTNPGSIVSTVFKDSFTQIAVRLDSKQQLYITPPIMSQHTKILLVKIYNNIAGPPGPLLYGLVLATVPSTARGAQKNHYNDS